MIRIWRKDFEKNSGSLKKTFPARTPFLLLLVLNDSVSKPASRSDSDPSRSCSWRSKRCCVRMSHLDVKPLHSGRHWSRVLGMACPLSRFLPIWPFYMWTISIHGCRTENSHCPTAASWRASVCRHHLFDRERESCPNRRYVWHPDSVSWRVPKQELAVYRNAQCGGCESQVRSDLAHLPQSESRKLLVIVLRLNSLVSRGQLALGWYYTTL